MSIYNNIVQIIKNDMKKAGIKRYTCQYFYVNKNNSVNYIAFPDYYEVKPNEVVYIYDIFGTNGTNIILQSENKIVSFTLSSVMVDGSIYKFKSHYQNNINIEYYSKIVVKIID